MSVHLARPDVLPRLLKVLDYTTQSADVKISDTEIVFNDSDGNHLATVSGHSAVLADFLTCYPELVFSGYVQSQRSPSNDHIHFMLCISGIPEYYDGIGESLCDEKFYLQEPDATWDEIMLYDNPHVLGREGKRSARYRTSQPGQSRPKPVYLPKFVAGWDVPPHSRRYGCRGCENAAALVTWDNGSSLVLLPKQV